jgi:hypothetical protein
MTCRSVHCVRCGRAIRCGHHCMGSNRARRWLCGQGDCASGLGRKMTFWCSSACYGRARRARIRVEPRPRRCAAPGCLKRFTPQRSIGRFCSGACRQRAFRQRTEGRYPRVMVCQPSLWGGWHTGLSFDRAAAPIRPPLFPSRTLVRPLARPADAPEPVAGPDIPGRPSDAMGGLPVRSWSTNRAAWRSALPVPNSRMHLNAFS